MDSESVSNINLETFKNILYNLDRSERVIVRFTADWCGPCKKIDPIVKELVLSLPSHIKYIEIDISESLELYVNLKKYKQVNGIPAILVYNTRNINDDKWYISNDAVLGSDIESIKNLFNKTINLLSD